MIRVLTARGEGEKKIFHETQTSKIEIKLSQIVNGITAVLFSICDKKLTNQRREQKCHIFVADVTNGKF